MGRHASGRRRRGIAAWPVITGVIVVLIAGATTALIISNNQQTPRCSSAVNLPVAASAGVADAVTALASSYNATNPVARSSCVTVQVAVTSGSLVVAGLESAWKGMSDPAPGLWVADSLADATAVDGTDPAVIAGHSSDPIATSPVVIAVRSAHPAVSPALSWKDLVGTDGASSLVLALPDPVANSASNDAIQSVVAGVASTSKAVDAADVAAASSALTELTGSASSAPTTTTNALTALSAGSAPYTAVPVLESNLARFNSRAGSNTLTALYPEGPTAGAEVLPIPVTAPWVDETISAATATFEAYLTSPAGLKILADQGLRVPGVNTSQPLTGVHIDQPVQPLPTADLQVQASLFQVIRAPAPTASSPPASTTRTATGSLRSSTPAVSASRSPVSGVSKTSTSVTTAKSSTTHSTTSNSVSPASSPVITFVIDKSASMSILDGVKTRAQWVQLAVTAVIAAHPNANFGLWTVSPQDHPRASSRTLSALPATIARLVRS